MYIAYMHCIYRPGLVDTEGLNLKIYGWSIDNCVGNNQSWALAGIFYFLKNEKCYLWYLYLMNFDLG